MRLRCCLIQSVEWGREAGIRLRKLGGSKATKEGMKGKRMVPDGLQSDGLMIIFVLIIVIVKLGLR